MNPKDLRQWVCWRYEERDGRPTKVPYSPTLRTRARCDDPTMWTTFAEAWDAVRKKDYDGIGFVFTERDPFCGVDLDGCLNPASGEVETWASEIVEDLNSYTEVSPGGAGLHVIVRTKLPEDGNRKGRIELYDRGRFFTVTGRRLPGTTRAVEDRQNRIQALHTRLFPPQEQEPSADEVGRSGLADEEVIRRAMSAANGDKLARLWSGDRSGYASDSEADLALCSMLAFWTGPAKGIAPNMNHHRGLQVEHLLASS